MPEGVFSFSWGFYAAIDEEGGGGDARLPAQSLPTEPRRPAQGVSR